MSFVRVSLVPLVLAALVLLGVTLGLDRRAPREHARDEVSVQELLATHRQVLFDLEVAIHEAIIAAHAAAIRAELDRLEREAGRPPYLCRYPILRR